ncbi:MAG: WYL domain-containing protein, partial [Opitutales bacterium]
LAVRPLGLVLKAGSWNLVVMGRGRVDVLCIDQLRATRMTNEPFVRPSDFNLNEFWRSRGNDDQS